MVSNKFSVPQLSSTQLNLLRVVAKIENLSGDHVIAYVDRLWYDHGHFISGVVAKAYIKKLQNAYLDW